MKSKTVVLKKTKSKKAKSKDKITFRTYKINVDVPNFLKEVEDKEEKLIDIKIQENYLKQSLCKMKDIEIFLDGMITGARASNQIVDQKFLKLGEDVKHLKGLRSILQANLNNNK